SCQRIAILLLMTTNAVNMHSTDGAMTERRAERKDEADGAIDAPANWSGSAPAPKRSITRPRDIGALQGHLGYFLRRAQVAVFQDFIRTLSSIDIRPAQYSVLIVTGANPGLSQADVAELLGI